MKCGHLILRTVIKFVAPGVRFYGKNALNRLSAAPDPAGGAYSAPSGPLAGSRGPTSKKKNRIVQNVQVK